MDTILKSFIKDINLYDQILSRDFDPATNCEGDITTIIAGKIALETSQEIKSEEMAVLDESLEKLFQKNKLNKELFKHIVVTKEKEDNGDERISLGSDIDGLAEYIASLTAVEIEELMDTVMERPFELKSVLINVCISFETFCSSLLKLICELPENHSSLSDKSLSYQDLIKIGDIEYAKNYILDRYLEDVFRKRFSDWVGIIADHLNKQIVKDNKELIDSVDELYQIRNLFVHNNGIVNSNFKKNANTDSLSIGEGFNLTVKLIKKKMADLENLSWILYYYFLSRMTKNNESTFKILNNLIVKYIDRDIKAISDILLEFSTNKHLKEEDKLIAKVNYFLHKKMNGRFEEVKDEVEKFQVLHLSEVFRIAKDLLMDGEGIIEKTQTYVDNMSSRDVFTQCSWPIFKATNYKEEIELIFNRRIEEIFGIKRRKNVRKNSQ